MGDILDRDKVFNAMKGCKIIFHLAAKHHEFTVGPQKGLKINKKDFYETNVKGTKNLLDIASELNISNFIFFSSVAVYGERNLPSDETKNPKPDTDYGKSKLTAEKLICDWVRSNCFNKALIIRPVVVYGENNWANVYHLIDSIAKNRFLQVGRGSNKKAMAYIENLYEAVIFAWNNMKNKNRRLEIYNYTDYPILTTKEIIDLIYKALDKTKPPFYIPYFIGLLGGKVFDIVSYFTSNDIPISSEKIKKFCSSTEHFAEKIRKEGFKQKYTIEYGLNKMVSWYKTVNGS